MLPKFAQQKELGLRNGDKMNQDVLLTKLQAAIDKSLAARDTIIANLNETIAQRNGLIESLSARIDYLEAQISAARKALENAQFTEALNILDAAESEGK